MVCTIEGVYVTALGLKLIAGGFTLGAGGAALSSTGGGAVFGSPAIAVSGGVVALGSAVTTGGYGIIQSSINNMYDNISKAESSSSDIDKAELNKEAEEIKEKTDKVKDIKFKKDYYVEHMTGPVEKFTTRGGVSGGHNYDEFKKYFSNSDKYELNTTKINKSNIEGLYDVEYTVKVEKKDFRGQGTGEYKIMPNGDKVYRKTVYDPDIISNEKIINLSKNAIEEGITNNRIELLKSQNKVKIFGQTQYDNKIIKFEGLKNLETGEIENAFPVLEWGNK